MLLKTLVSERSSCSVWRHETEGSPLCAEWTTKSTAGSLTATMSLCHAASRCPRPDWVVATVTGVATTQSGRTHLEDPVEPHVGHRVGKRPFGQN